MRKFHLLSLLLIVVMMFTACSAQSAQAALAAQVKADAAPAGEEVTLTIESWCNDDIAILEGGSAADLITARPFDASRELFKQGSLASLNGLPGMENFGDVAKRVWITDDGSDVFAVPIASVIHGFFYIKDAFTEVGVEFPTTKAELMAVLEAFKEDDAYIPLAMGPADLWETATMDFMSWRGKCESPIRNSYQILSRQMIRNIMSGAIK